MYENKPELLCWTVLKVPVGTVEGRSASKKNQWEPFYSGEVATSRNDGEEAVQVCL